MIKQVRAFGTVLALAGLSLGLALWFLLPSPTYAVDHTVGGGCGPTIQDCLDFAGPGDTVIVPAGVWTESVTLNKAVNLTGVSSATAIIEAVTGQRVLTITGATIGPNVVVSELTLRSGDVSAGTTCFTGDTTNCGGGIVLSNTARPTLQNLIVENNKAREGGGIYANATGGLTLDGVVLRNNTSTLSGGGVHARNMPVTITNSIFEGNTTTDNVGGAIRTGADFGVVAPVLIKSSIFLTNTAPCASGGICEGAAAYHFNQDVQIQSSHFQGNSCTDGDCDGGGAYIFSTNNVASLLVIDTDFVDNIAGGGGGGVSVGNLIQVSIVNGRFENNRALNGDGGGFNHANFLIAADAAINGTQFISNSAAIEGGGLYSVSDMAIRNARFERNASGEDGGGIFIDFAGAGTSLNNTNLLNNSAQSDGGGAYILGDNFTATDPTFSDNNAVGDGGGLHACATVTLTRPMIINNLSQENGGGVYIGPRDSFSGCGSVGNTLVVQQGHFEGNISQKTLGFGSEGGGGIYVGNTGSLALNDTDFIDNQATASGGGAKVIGSAAVNEGMFQNNTATNGNGGGIRATKNLIIDNVQFTDNVAGTAGGGVQASGIIDILNTHFQNNRANSGGGMSAGNPSTATVTISNTQFYSNSALSGVGGGLDAGLNTKILAVTNSLFEGNNSATDGGGLYAFNGPFILQNTQFLSNTAVNGGGLNFTFNPIDAVDVLIQGNIASGNGGGIHTFGTATFSGDWSVINNRATGDGGGIWANSALRATNGRIDRNSSSGSGGGYYGALANLFIDGTSFTNNEAGGDGGGAYASSAWDVEQVHFENNSAANVGGGLLLTRFVRITATRFLDNSARLGGGLAVSNTFGGSAVQFTVNTVFANNIASENGTSVYYNQPRPIRFVHNTLAQVGVRTGSSIYVNTATVTVTNSILTKYNTAIENAGGLVFSEFNLFYNNGNDTIGTVATSDDLVGNPNFLNATNDDFRLIKSSPAIDSGTNAGITRDILGGTRPEAAGFDRGAYEGGYATVLYLPMMRRPQ